MFPRRLLHASVVALAMSAGTAYADPNVDATESAVQPPPPAPSGPRNKQLMIAGAVVTSLGVAQLLASIAPWVMEQHADTDGGTAEAAFAGLALSGNGAVMTLVGVPMLIVGALPKPSGAPQAWVPDVRVGAGVAHLVWRF
jgi:hypothetical protein